MWPFLKFRPRASTPISPSVCPRFSAAFAGRNQCAGEGAPFRWVRPLRSIVSVIEDGSELQPVPFELEGIPIGCVSRGHPFMAGRPFRIGSVENYSAQLEAAFVLLASADRRARIEDGAKRLAKENGLELVDDPGLLDELAGLVEWPVLHFGRIDPDFRHLPGEVLRAAMRTHQRYLSLREPEGGGIAGYVAVADTEPDDGGAQVRAGYARVLRARLSDAAFFWANDCARGLENMHTGLQGMVYHAQLGGVAERVERVAFLAGRIASRIGADTVQVHRGFTFGQMRSCLGDRRRVSNASGHGGLPTRGPRRRGRGCR